MNVGRESIATTEKLQPVVGGNRGRRIAVVGGGIAGLTTALAFARTGARVMVFERAHQIREIGAGIQITPNGARGLEALGLGDALERIGVAAEAVTPMDAQSGRRVARFDLSELSGPRYRFVFRSDLITLLAESCRQHDVILLPGTGIGSVTTRGHIAMSDGRFDQADLVIGSDGIHSIARGVLNQGLAAQFSGQVAWRAVVDGVHPPEARIWMGPKRHLVSYPLPGNKINLVAVQERASWAPEGWNYDDTPQSLMEAFSGASDEVMDLLSRVQTPKLWGLFNHPVAPVWAHERLAIIGDAAHPTLPFLAQGANLAIEDAVTLALAMDRKEGLEQWQQKRFERVSRAIKVANSNARNYHLKGPAKLAAHVTLGGLSKLAPNAYLNSMDWLYGFDPLA